MRGMNTFMDAVQDPERSFETFFSTLAGSAVPTLVADVARATDTTERMSYSPGRRVMSRIPLLRETLEPRVNVFGNDVPRFGGDPFEVMVDPTRPIKVRQDVVVDEMRRLWNKNVKVSPTMLGNKEGYSILSDHENTVLWRRSGKLMYHGIHAIINQSWYDGLSNEDKGKEIERVIQEAKTMARTEAASIKLQYGATMEELKESGLVNQTIERSMVLTR